MMELSSVSFHYGYKLVLNDVSATFEPGRRYVVKAPNGSGKSTLLQIMAGLKVPSRGQVCVQGQPMGTQARRTIGYVAQQPMLFGDLTASENLSLYAKLYGVRATPSQVVAWLDDVGLRQVRDDRVKTFSKGMRQRLSMARALLHNPTYILLDEPYDGLDDGARQRCSDILMNRLNQRAAIVMVTHHAEDILDSDIRLTIQHGSLVSA